MPRLDAEGNAVRGDTYLVSDGKYLPDLQPASADARGRDLRGAGRAPGRSATSSVGIVDRTPYESTLSTGIRYGFAALVAEVPITLEQGAQAPASPEPEPEPTP